MQVEIISSWLCGACPVLGIAEKLLITATGSTLKENNL
jgi:hypothetical protein